MKVFLREWFKASFDLLAHLLFFAGFIGIITFLIVGCIWMGLKTHHGIGFGGMMLVYFVIVQLIKRNRKV